MSDEQANIRVADVLDQEQQARLAAVTGAAQILKRSPGFGRTEVANAYEVIGLAEYILTGRWGEDDEPEGLSVDDRTVEEFGKP